METTIKKVVLIEDNPNSSKLAQKLLRKSGFEVFAADDGETGYELAVENAPDIVLVDLGLPDMDGQTVVGILKQEPDMSGVPIIAFTAYPEDKAREMAQAYGCDGVITKPIDTRNFADQVKTFLSKPTELEG